jgi:hypothetical protein
MNVSRLKAAVIVICGLAGLIVAAATIESVQAQARQPTVLGPVVDIGDGAPTMQDTCPGTVVIDQCDTGIPALLDDGTCMQTLVDDCAQTATTQDSFVNCVMDLRDFVRDSDVDALTSCAVQAAPRPITSSIGGTGEKEKGKKLPQGKCKDKAVVAVAATIYGGKAGNQITVSAKCGENVVATATATDPAGGNLDSKGMTGQQVEGDLKCEAKYAGAAPDSDWLVSCVFFQ